MTSNSLGFNSANLRKRAKSQNDVIPFDKFNDPRFINNATIETLEPCGPKQPKCWKVTMKFRNKTQNVGNKQGRIA